MIKNLLFDLGGVIMDIDRNHCVEAFKKLGMKNPDSFLGEYSQTGPFGDLESGKITVDEFHNALRPFLPASVTDEQMDAAFSDFLLGIPESRLNALKELRKKYKVYILSNTNPIMWHNRIATEFTKQGGDISTYIDGAVTSFEEKTMKPDDGIFIAACKKLNIKPEETVFLDDSLANTQAAAALGFDTIHVAPGTEFTDLLKTKGI
ncbi:MAG: HAD family phosphatase [Paramuribaculum sp.]|nr:HAD family phosphatase [Paramuribaculum sp.]